MSNRACPSRPRMAGSALGSDWRAVHYRCVKAMAGPMLVSVASTEGAFSAALVRRGLDGGC